MFEQFYVGRLSLDLPFGTDRGDGLRQSNFVAGHNAHEIPVVDDGCIREQGHLRGVERSQLRIQHARPQNAALQHAGPLEVAGIAMRSRHDVARVDFGHGGARDVPVVRGSDDSAGHGFGDLAILSELAEAHGFPGGRVLHLAVYDGDRAALVLSSVRRRDRSASLARPRRPS